MNPLASQAYKQLLQTVQSTNLPAPLKTKLSFNLRRVAETVGFEDKEAAALTNALLDKLDFLLQPHPATPSRSLTEELPPQPAVASNTVPPPEGQQSSIGIALDENPSGKVSISFEFKAEAHEAAENAEVVVPAQAPSAAAVASPEKPPALTFNVTDGAAREIMLVLSDAIETRKPVIIEPAIDCIQRMISFKLLHGPVFSINHRREVATKSGENWEGPAPLQFAAQPPQAQAIELLCRCDDIADDAVELRLLKALLTAVTSATLSIHSQALLLVVRTCHNIYLTSKADVNQSTAKATLTQMLNVVFQRMEAGSTRVVVPPIVVSDLFGLSPTENSNVSVFVQQFLNDVATNIDPFGYYAEGVQQGLDDAFSHERVPSTATLASTETAAAPPVIGTSDAPAGGVSRPESTNSLEASAAAGKTPPPSRPPSSNGLAPETASTPSIIAQQQQLGDIDDPAAVQQILQKDAFLVFRALCKLSIRSIDATSGSEVATVRGKLLALQLLKVLLENIGPVFQSSPRFVSAIKQYLCLSLLKNATSSLPQAQHLCCSIFLTLISKFRKNLKAEVGVFFPMMLLKPVEPQPQGAPPPTPSDIAHKVIILRCLQAICGDGQLLVDLFVNYDCDLEGANLFERMVLAVVRIAQKGMLQDNVVAGLDDRSIRYEALRCLSSCIRSMSRWYDTTGLPPVVPFENTSDSQKLKIADSKSDLQQQSNSHSASNSSLAAGLGVVDEGLRSSWMESLASGTTLPGPNLALSGMGGEGDRNQVALLEAWKAFKRAFEEGIVLFNRKPKAGISFLQEQQLLGVEAEDVALFLARTRGLDKTLVGDYLGERETFNLAVMHSYVNNMDFTDLEFDNAIRKFLAGFRLPGEAQKIDRLMEKFADRYVSCNQEAFKSADVAYVLAYSVIMLNTDAHNPMVKNKMSKADFLRNNRGINDGQDLDVEFMEALYDRIINNEIKMKDENVLDDAAAAAAAKQPGGAASWIDTVMNLIPGRQRATSSEPTEESIKRTHEFLREKASAATFFEAKENEVVRPMLDVTWAPMLGAFSVSMEEQDDGNLIVLCLKGFFSAIHLTSNLQMTVLQRAFISTLTRFTCLHAPANIRSKNVEAFRVLLAAAERDGNSFTECWPEVLRCVSRFELIHSMLDGVPTDAALFGDGGKTAANGVGGRGNGKLSKPVPRRESFGIADMGLQMPAPGSGKEFGLPPYSVFLTFDVQDINRLYVSSGGLNSDAIVEFVRVMCAVAREELDPAGVPRVFSLGKIVEVAHFNMDRIRLVWSRIWAVLADFFVDVGCHENLQVAMYAVDSLRQLAMKFLEREELTNYTFQNDFLRPFVVLMRHSKAVEIRELVIRCVSQMVLSRVSQIKSGWKSMFMVFTTAASDEDPRIVRLAFDTIERIVRDHFHRITETESATFTDAVNCLVAFTNHPQSTDVCLNAIAFLRYCALQLAEGGIGDVEQLPEGVFLQDSNLYRIRAKDGGEVIENAVTSPLSPKSPGSQASPRLSGVKFTDRDEHMYFWFPLLAGLSELTFDPRPEIRYSSQEVLFDILMDHGGSFSPQFWVRVFDSILLPIFDIVRAEVADATTFTDERHRAASDAWLYETCTRTLQHIVDVVVRYGPEAPGLLERLLNLLLSFIRRSHQALAEVGVAATARLVVCAGTTMDEPTWRAVLALLATAVDDTVPRVAELVQLRMTQRTITESGTEAAWSLGSAAGARKLAEVRSRAAIQLLLVQALAEVFQNHADRMSDVATSALLDSLQKIGTRASDVNGDVGLRHSLLLAQAADKVSADKALEDPPFLQLEIEATEAYLSVLVYIVTRSSKEKIEATEAHPRLLQLCMRTLERFDQQTSGATYEIGAHNSNSENGNGNALAPNLKADSLALAPLIVSTLKALLALEPEEFKNHLKDIFPLLTNLISCETAPAEVQVVLSEVFARRVGSMVVE